MPSVWGKRMTKSTAALCAALIVAASAANANTSVEPQNGVVLHTTEGAIAAESTTTAADVKPGDTFTITGDCIARDASADSLRVVLTLADQASGAAPGFRSAIATDQAIRGSNLEVRVPDLPQAANRIFDVRVFRLGSEEPLVCDAGSLRIGAATGGKVG